MTKRNLVLATELRSSNSVLHCVESHRLDSGFGGLQCMFNINTGVQLSIFRKYRSWDGTVVDNDFVLSILAYFIDTSTMMQSMLEFFYPCYRALIHVCVLSSISACFY